MTFGFNDYPTLSSTAENNKDGILEYQNPLDLSVDDKALVGYLETRIDKSKDYYKREKKLYERQTKNLGYLLGLGQLDFSRLKDYQAKYMDNLIYESEASIKPIALSRLPELFVKPSSAGDEAKDIADNLTKILNNDLRQRENRAVLGLAFRQHPVFFIGIIKYRWDPNKGKFGDYVFDTVHPKNVTLDHTARRPDPDKMDFIAETLEMTIKEAMIMFPDKKREILLESKLPVDEEASESQLGTKIKIYEVWFCWYEGKSKKKTIGGDESEEAEAKEGDENYEDKSYSKIEGVCWKYGKTILKKMKNPNYDWEGEETPVITIDGQVKKASPDDIKLALLAQMGATVEGAPEVGVEKMYRNYFAHPRKPYIFITYDQWGEMPYDETSRIEQSIPLQDTVNKRGRQITEMADRTRGKYIFSTDSGLKKEDIEELDLDDPDSDILVDGNVRDVYSVLVGEQPSAALFQEQDISRSRVFSKMGVHDTTRGQKETDTATTSQILREADYGRIDDLTEETINFAAEQMAQAAMHMIKLRYTEEHMRHLLGEDGEVVHMAISGEMIDEAMEVTVHSSGTDKILRRREAYERAGMQMTDPLTFFQDTDAPNPRERAKRLFMFQNDPAGYASEYLIDEAQRLQQTAQMGAQLNGGDGGAQQAMMDLARLQQGDPGVVPPPQPSPEYVQTISTFVKSAEFANLDPQLQQVVQQYAQTLLSATQGMGQMMEQQPGMAVGG